MVCAYRMGLEVLVWLPIVLTISIGFAISQNILLPHFQSEHGAGAFRPFGQLAELDLSAAGPFWSPFWATFGYYHPGELSGAPSGAFVAPARPTPALDPRHPWNLRHLWSLCMLV